MTEWWTYRLHSFLMFSPRTYWRMVEEFNREWWFIGVALSLALVVLRRRPLVVLALAWAWVAWAFLWERYSQIFLAAPWFAAAFALQAAALSFAGWRCPKDTPAAVAVGSCVAYPLATAFLGGSIARAQLFGMHPDPTAVITLFVVMTTTRGKTRWLLSIIPALAIAIGALTLYALLE